MKAIVYNRYGPPEVLKLAEVDKPTPKEDEVLIRIYATSVSSGDWHVRKADPFLVRMFFGFFRPKKKVLGGVLAGLVERTGKNVSKFKKGDKIFGSTGVEFGTYAEYTCVNEDAVLSELPKNLNFEEAAAIPFGANTALYFLRKADIQENQRVLIYGASGAVGTAAVQLANSLGAEVTAVCSTKNIELVKSLGAHKVIDYTKEDFTKMGVSYDVIYETVGKASLSECLGILEKGGTLLMNSAGLKQMLLGIWKAITGTQKIVSGVMSETAEDMRYIKTLIENGRFTPVIDRKYTLDEIPEAHRYVEKGHKVGNVVVVVYSDSGGAESEASLH